MNHLFQKYEEHLRKKRKQYKEVHYRLGTSIDFKFILKSIKVLWVVVLIFAIIIGSLLVKLVAIGLLVLQSRMSKVVGNMTSEDKKFAKFVEYELFKIIESNGYFSLDSDKEGNQWVKDSASLKYAFDDYDLSIRAYGWGYSYAPKMKELQTYLESALGYPVEKVIHMPKYTEYKIRRVQVKRLEVTNENVMMKFNVNEGVIALDSELKWKYDKQPHALITGITGSGKSQFVKYLMLESYKQGAEVYIFDPKGEWGHFVNIEGFDCKYYASSPNEISAKLRELVEVMEERFSSFDGSKGEHHYREYGYKPIFVYFEEMIATKVLADKKTQEEIMKRLTALIVKARAAGIQIVLITQSARGDILDTTVREQLGLKIVLGNMGDTALKMALGDYDELPTMKFDTFGVGYCKLSDMVNPFGYRTPIMSKGLNYEKVVEDLLAIAVES